MNQHYPLSVGGDSITTNDIAYPRSTCAADMLLEHLLRAESERGLVERCGKFRAD